MASMDVAVVDGQRLPPAPGLKGVCERCGAPAQAKCGPIVRWHWAHAGRRHCDPWMENEGPWHKAWKELFPFEWREVVARDHKGEKHVADVRRPDGVVIELQNSPMSIEEMQSRESFYGPRMIWIVNAQRFRDQLHILEALPNPDADFVADLEFVPPIPAALRNRVKIRSDGQSLMFYRRSDVFPDGGRTWELHSGRSLGGLVAENYIGHHHCVWIKPREVWKRAERTVVLDCGGGTLWAIRRYGVEQFFCVQRVAPGPFISSLLDGRMPELSSKRVSVGRYSSSTLPSEL